MEKKSGGGGAKILAVIPSEDMRKLFRAMLSVHAGELLMVNDSVRGAELAKEARPDLVIATCGLYDEGVDLCRYLRAEETLHATPFVLMTTTRDQRKYTEYFEAGCDQILPIPFRTAALFTVISEALGGKAVSRGASVQVLYRTGATDYVSNGELDRLIHHREILGFRRRDGVVVLGRDPVRVGRQIGYEGPERRSAANGQD